MSDASICQAKEKLSKLPKINIGFYPTPFHKLDHLSELLGINLYLKREDLSGFSPFGGNKIRKLEYIIADAIQKGFTKAITFGAIQSNHAMQTAAACRKYNLEPILYLHDEYDNATKQKFNGNFWLDSVLGAEIHTYPSKQEAEQNAIRRIEEESIYYIPSGGASIIGTAGFFDAFFEIQNQAFENNVKIDYIYHASGSGGTLAGLLAGKTVGQSPIEIISIAVGEKDDTYEETVTEKANQFLQLIDLPIRSSAQDIHFNREFYLPGYGLPNMGASNAIKLLAQKEGILLDPVYTGKAFQALLKHVEEGRIPQNSTVVFLHTGGSLALFSGTDVIGPWLP